MGIQDVTTFLGSASFERLVDESPGDYIERAVDVAAARGLDADIAAAALSSLLTSGRRNAFTRQLRDTIGAPVIPQSPQSADEMEPAEAVPEGSNSPEDVIELETADSKDNDAGSRLVFPNGKLPEIELDQTLRNCGGDEPYGTGNKVQSAFAESACRFCRVQIQCGIKGLEADEEFGVWGGFTEADRRRLKRRDPLALRKVAVVLRRMLAESNEAAS
jgi:hypothetical protein